MTVTVKKIGGSFAVLIPRSVAIESKITEGLSVEVSSTTEGVLLRTRGVRARRPISKIVRQIKPTSYATRLKESASDRPVGKEIW